MRASRYYTASEKRAALALVREVGQREAARRLKVTRVTLRRWIAEQSDADLRPAA
jgi:transposase-like protein